MNLVDLLAALGTLDRVTWRRRSSDDVVRVTERANGKVTLEHQMADGSWRKLDPMDTTKFLQAYEPIR